MTMMNEKSRLIQLEVDTVELRKNGEEALKLVAEYQLLISEFYDRISKIDRNLEWIGSEGQQGAGTSVFQFIQRSLKELPNYQEFGESLQKCGQALIDYATELELLDSDQRMGGKE